MLPLVSDWVSGNWGFGHKEWLLRQCHTWYLDKETKNSRQKKAGTMTPLWEPKLTFSLNCEEKLTRVQSRECPLEWWSFSIPVALWDYCPMVFTYPHCCVLAKKRLFSTVCFLDLCWGDLAGTERERYEKRAGAINPNALRTISSAHIFSFSLEE